MHVTFIRQKSLLMSNMKHGTMRYFRVLSQTTSELLRVPGIKVRIKVQHCDFAPCVMKCAKCRKSYSLSAVTSIKLMKLTDCVVTTNADDSDVVTLLSVLRSFGSNCSPAAFQVSKCFQLIICRICNISTVNNSSPVAERVHKVIHAACC